MNSFSTRLFDLGGKAYRDSSLTIWSSSWPWSGAEFHPMYDPTYRDIPQLSSRPGQYMHPPYYLDTAGCQPDPFGPVNCTTACTNITWLLTFPYALSVCVTASLIVGQLAASTSSQDYNTTEEANTIGITQESPRMSQVIGPVSNCFNEYCGSTGLCATGGRICANLSSISLNQTGLINHSDQLIAINTLQDCVYNDVCPANQIATNGDIGGIGVTNVQNRGFPANRGRFSYHIIYSFLSAFSGSYCCF